MKRFETATGASEWNPPAVGPDMLRKEPVAAGGPCWGYCVCCMAAAIQGGGAASTAVAAAIGH